MNRIISTIVRRLLTSALPFAAALLLTGCAQEQPTPEAFFPEKAGEAVTTILDAQIARGARGDATLYNAHFDDRQLSELGKDKLTWMLRDSGAALPLAIYVDAADATLRADAVAAQLREMGLKDGQFRITSGGNPATARQASSDITALKRLDTPAIDSQSSDLPESTSGSAPTTPTMAR